MIDNSNKENNIFFLEIDNHPIYHNVSWRITLEYGKEDIPEQFRSTLEKEVKCCLSKAVVLFDLAKTHKNTFQQLYKKHTADPKAFFLAMEKNQDTLDDVTCQYLDFYKNKREIKSTYQQYGNHFIATMNIIFCKCSAYIKKSIEKKLVSWPEDNKLKSVKIIPKEGKGMKLTEYVRKGSSFFPTSEEGKKRKPSEEIDEIQTKSQKIK